MSHYLRLRIVPPELAEQVEQRTFLGVGTGVGRGSRLIEAAFITDADAPVVPPGCMCADLVDGTATVEIAVAGDIEMIALMPSAPAMALATAMITLRSTPQTDFFSFFCSMMRFMIYDLKSMGQGPALRFSLAFNCQLSIA